MEHKIIFTGTVGAGKSQAISTISDIEVVSTEARATDETAEKKDLTTVAMDYGVMNLDGGQRLHLYGTPGQERFSFMWDILTLGGLGLVILIDNSIDDPLGNVRLYLEAFSQFIQQNPVVIGVTHMDVAATPRLSDYREVAASLKVSAPVLEVDSRCVDDVKTLLKALITQIQYRGN